MVTAGSAPAVAVAGTPAGVGCLAACYGRAQDELADARKRLSGFLLGRGLRFTGGCRGVAHGECLNGLRFEDDASAVVFNMYVGEVGALEQRCSALQAAIARAWPGEPWAGTIRRLACLRGLDTLGTFGVFSETGDLDHFEHPTALAAFPRVEPGEHPQHPRRDEARLNARGVRARVVLFQAGVHYCHRPVVGRILARRQAGQDPRACEVAWRAQLHLHKDYRRLRLRCGQPAVVVTRAPAHELCGYVWRLGQLR